MSRTASSIRARAAARRMACSPAGRPALVLLFVLGVMMALGMFTYMPCRLVAGALASARDRSAWHVAAGPLVLALAAALGGVRWFFLFLCSFLEYLRYARLDEEAPATDWPLVSILVPACNEGRTIAAALESLIRLEYPRLEILVVDDGSTDRTLALARAHEGRYGHCEVRVFHKPNGGKSSALNYAFQRSRGELVLCMDADSRLEPDCLRWMVRRMRDPRVHAVAGQIRVRNRRNLLTGLQGLEYVIGNAAVRMSQSRFGTVLVIAGALGMFRRSALEEVFLTYGAAAAGPARPAGPWEHDTFAEDFDLTLAVLSLGASVVYEPRAISQTQAPDAPLSLMSQRYRWMRGTLQALRKYFRRAASRPQRRSARLLAWVCGSYLYDLLLQPLLVATGLAVFVLSLLRGHNLAPLAGFWLAFTALHLVAASFYIRMHDDDLRLLQVVPFFELYQSLLLHASLAIAVLDELRGAPMRW